MTSLARPDRDQILRLVERRKRHRLLGRVTIALGLALGVTAFWFWRARNQAAPALDYRTVAARLGSLRETVTATGTLKGKNTVDVGAQISGRIAEVMVDYNDSVTTGQVLAEIDPEQLRSRVEQSRAQVRAADAAIRLARASTAQARAQMERTRELNTKGLASSRELETTIADAERAEASVASAEAQATLARATLKDAETSLSYTSIRAPIDGIVLNRLVEPGQTVAASLQSPVLFTLASDLSALELNVDIDEADVGRVKEGQGATFTVDAWPGRSFASSVVSIRNLPTTGQTVVTYQASLSVENQERLLRPGMTATATIITAENPSALLVPNVALRFAPPDTSERGLRLPFFGTRRGPSGEPPSSPRLGESEGTVFLLSQGLPLRKIVKIGGTDGEWTHVTDASVQVGDPLIVDALQPKP